MIEDTIDTITALVVVSLIGVGCTSTRHVSVTHEIQPAPETTIEQFFTPPPPGVTISRPPPFWPPHEHVGPGADTSRAPWNTRPATF